MAHLDYQRLGHTGQNSYMDIWPINWYWSCLKEQFAEFPVLAADPLPVVAGAISGVVGRSVALVFAPPGEKGLVQTVLRRAPQWGVFFWVYIPFQAAVTREYHHPGQKAFSTFYFGGLAAWYMRVICNPIDRVLVEAAREEVSPFEAAKRMKNKGVLNFYYTSHPLWASYVYFGTLACCFEGTRRFLERSGWSTDTTAGHVSLSAVSGGIGAALASTITYPFSRMRYSTTVIHDSAINAGRIRTLMKEVPMCAATFGTFAAIMPFFAPHHGQRTGFGN